MKTETEIRIIELTRAKDHLERCIEQLRISGYTAYNDTFRNLVKERAILKGTIMSLQLGTLPYVRVAV